MRTACLDWEDRIVKRESLIPFPPLYPENAAEAIAVFNSLRMVDVMGSPRIGDVVAQWTLDFVGQIFGSYENETGIRHITEYMLLISKKNSKSTCAAAIMLTALILNWRQSAEFIILSPTVEVAQNSFKPAADMVRADAELSDIFMVQDHIRTITHRVTGATLKVVAADSATVSGKKAVGVLVDELHELGKRPNADSMLREAQGGLASRSEGFVIYLTTQSDEPPTGVFKTKLEYARKVRDGLIDDPQFLPMLYEFPDKYIKDELYLKPENFYVTNPNMGRSVNEDFLMREYRKAQEEGDQQVRDFLAKHVNVEIGLNLRGDRWPGADYWLPAAKAPGMGLDELLARCEVCTVGIDGGGLDDLLGFAVVGRERGTGKWLAWCRAWAHPSVLDRRKSIESKLRELELADELVIVDDIGEDTQQLAAIVAQIEQANLLDKCGLDPASIGGVLDAIESEGVPAAKMVSVNQGWRLAGSIKTTERKLAEGILLHNGGALMNWCVGNAKVKAVGNAIVITKQISGSAKIDPLMALFNAVSLMALNPPSPESSKSFWEM